MKLPRGIQATRFGYRAFVSVKGHPRASRRFSHDTAIQTIKDWRDRTRVQLKGKTPQAISPDGTFATDAVVYLETVRAMPTIAERRKHIIEWLALFETRKRSEITPQMIRAQRDAWLTTDGYAGSSVNKRLRALQNMWTVLDGRHAYNPVREVPECDEPDHAPRALPYWVIAALIKAMPDRGRAMKDGAVPKASQTKARLAVMVWTGLPPAQIMRLERSDVDLERQQVFVRRRRKGKRGDPEAGVRGRVLPLNAKGVAAFRKFAALNCWGPFSTSSVYKSFQRAVKAVNKLPAFKKSPLVGIRPYDLRHSFVTEVLKATGDPKLAQRLAGHSSFDTTLKYVRGAVEHVERAAMRKFRPCTARKDPRNAPLRRIVRNSS